MNDDNRTQRTSSVERVQFLSTTQVSDLPVNTCVVMVDGTVPDWQAREMDYHYDHHRPGGDDIQLTEIPFDKAVEIRSRLTREEVVFVTTLADADAAAAVAYCLTGATGEHYRRLSAIAYDCDHLGVPDSLSDLSEFAFKVVATFKIAGNKLRDAFGLGADRRQWSSQDHLRFNSKLFERATHHYVDAIRGQGHWPGERGEAEDYRQSLVQMAERLKDERRVYSQQYISVADCRAMNTYVDPRATHLAWKQAGLLGVNPQTLTIHDHKLGCVSYTVGCIPLHLSALQLNYNESVYPRLTKMEQQQDNPSPTWGGRRSVGGSPWNAGSRLSVKQIIDVLVSAL